MPIFPRANRRRYLFPTVNQITRQRRLQSVQTDQGVIEDPLFENEGFWQRSDPWAGLYPRVPLWETQNRADERTLHAAMGPPMVRLGRGLGVGNPIVRVDSTSDAVYRQYTEEDAATNRRTIERAYERWVLSRERTERRPSVFSRLLHNSTDGRRDFEAWLLKECTKQYERLINQLMSERLQGTARRNVLVFWRKFWGDMVDRYHRGGRTGVPPRNDGRRWPWEDWRSIREIITGEVPMYLNNTVPSTPVPVTSGWRTTRRS